MCTLLELDCGHGHHDVRQLQAGFMALIIKVPHVDARGLCDVDDSRSVGAPTPSDILSMLGIAGSEDRELITLESRVPDAEVVTMHRQQQVVIEW